MKILSKFGVELHQRNLNNGINVFLFRRKGMPVYLRTVFFSGSRFDTIPGTAHFLEHMLLAGTKKFPTKNLISDHIQKVGGEFGATTNIDQLRLNVEIPDSHDLKIGLEILNESLTKSLFNPKTIEKERGAIISEFNSKKSNPKDYLWEVSRRLSLQGNQAGNSTLGSLENIQIISKKDLLDYKDKFISSGRATFLVSGDIEMEELCKGLENLMLPRSESVEIKDKLPIITTKTLDVETYKDFEQLHVSLSTRTSIDNYKEYCALKLLNSILGVGRGSRLMVRLRYENGLVYNVSSYLLDSIDWGNLEIHFSCDKKNAEQVKKIIFQEFDTLQKNNITEQELKDIQSRITKSAKRNFQTSKSWVDFHEKQAIFYPNDIKTIDDYIKTINSLNLQDISIVINKYLKKENFLMAVCGDY